MERISSRQNSIVKRFRELRNPSDDFMLLDGSHVLEEALEAGTLLDVVAVRDDLAGGPMGALARRAADRGARVLCVTGAVLGAMSPVRQPSGIVAIARRQLTDVESALGHPPQMVLVLADVQDPGNVGAIVRIADACGATGMITSERSADPFGWKAIRGSMGSAFRVPVASRQPLEGALGAARARGLHLFAAAPDGGTPLPRCDLRRPSAILLGGEGPGLPGPLVELADEMLTIPMRPGVDSLNVATAAALIAYEAQRQRGRWS
jgi:TrmH family RNA methyltransferase